MFTTYGLQSQARSHYEQLIATAADARRGRRSHRRHAQPAPAARAVLRLVSVRGS